MRPSVLLPFFCFKWRACITHILKGLIYCITQVDLVVGVLAWTSIRGGLQGLQMAALPLQLYLQIWRREMPEALDVCTTISNAIANALQCSKNTLFFSFCTSSFTQTLCSKMRRDVKTTPV